MWLIMALLSSLFLAALLLMSALLPSHTSHLPSRTTHAVLSSSLPPPRNPSLLNCPQEGAFQPGPTVRGERCLLQIQNWRLENAELLYLSSPGQPELRYWVIDYNSSFQLQAREGDHWLARSRLGLLLKEWVIPPCAHLPRRQVTVDLHPCTSPAAKQRPFAPALTPNPLASSQAASCATSLVLSSEPQPGMHLLCLSPAPAFVGAAFAVAAFAHSRQPDGVLLPTHSFLVPLPIGPEDDALRTHDQEGLNGEGLERKKKKELTPSALIAITMAEVRRALASLHPCCGGTSTDATTRQLPEALEWCRHECLDSWDGSPWKFLY